MPKIFISYRRDDNKAFVERIHDRLVVAFGKANVFQDVDDGIVAGTKWKSILKSKLDESDVLLVVIGKEWERIINERTHLPNDWVRYEVEQGLARDENILLIPVLIENTPFPTILPASIQAMAEYQIFPVRGNPDFNGDMDKLVGLLKKHHPSKVASPAPKSNLSIIAGFVLLLAIAISVLIFLPPLLNNGLEGTNVANNPTQTEEAIVTEPALVATDTTTNSPTNTPTDHPSPMDTDRPRNTPTDEPTATDTVRPRNTPTNEPTATESPTSTESPTNTSTDKPTATETSSPELTLANYETTIERARNFTGEQNSDWIPHIYTFEDDVEMVLVPVGCFMMGLNLQQIDYVIEELGALESSIEDEYFVEPYCITEPFWLDLTEVTQEDFNRLRGFKRNSNTSTGNDFPVDSITWFEARDYCELLDKRLPTEAEWEYAARGVESLLFPWGNQLDTSRGNYCDSTCSEPWADMSFYDGYPEVAPVGSFVSGISWVGALDMSGNVEEWTSSLWRLYPYDENDGREGEAAEGTGYFRISRDSSWGHITHTIRSSGRFGEDPYFAFQGQGFRCARDIN